MLTNTRTAPDIPLSRLLTRPLSYESFREHLWALTERYSCCRLQTVGQSAGGRSLYAVSLGEEGAVPALVYAGGFSPSDWLMSAVLLRFLEEYAVLLAEGERLYRIHLPVLYTRRRICVLPMANPDAFADQPDTAATEPDYRNGAGAEIPAYFSAAETHPVEKCPESAAIRQYLLWQSPDLLCVFGTGEENRLTIPTQPSSRSEVTGRLLARMLSARVTLSETPHAEEEPLSAIPAWYGTESGCPSCLVTAEDTGTEDCFLSAWAGLREMLFTAPLLVPEHGHRPAGTEEK